jgi:hypothetical protein
MVAWNEDRNAERKQTAELIRAVGLRLFNIQLAKGKSVTPHDFLPFPWDQEEDDVEALNEMTKEERKASLDEFMKKINW